MFKNYNTNSKIKTFFLFRKRSGYVPVYLRQTTNDLTGEHSCIMLNVLNEEEKESNNWLGAYWADFRRRFITLLSYQFKIFTPSLALSMLANKAKKMDCKRLTRAELDVYFTSYDVKRLEMYSNNLADYHLIIDLMPNLARIYFLHQMGDVQLSAVQSVSLV